MNYNEHMNTQTPTPTHTYAYSYTNIEGHPCRTLDRTTAEDAWCDMMTQEIDWDQGEPLLRRYLTVTTPGPQA